MRRCPDADKVDDHDACAIERPSQSELCVIYFLDFEHTINELRGRQHCIGNDDRKAMCHGASDPCNRPAYDCAAFAADIAAIHPLSG